MAEKRNDISIFTNQEISLAMAYIPWQEWENPYEISLGFKRGTIYPRLDKPFLGEEAVKNVR